MRTRRSKAGVMMKGSDTDEFAVKRRSDSGRKRPAALDNGVDATASATQRAWEVLRRDKTALVGGAVALLLVLVAVFAPWIAPHDPNYQFADGLTVLGEPLPPGPGHLLGTDMMGRDLLSRLIYGSRISLAIGLAASALALIIGVMVGSLAGYLGGLVDGVLMRLVDATLAFPNVLFMMALAAMLPRGIGVIVLVIVAFSWAYPARIFYGQILSIKTRPYVEAAFAQGASQVRLLIRHVLPQIIPLLIVYFTLRVPTTILAEAGLSFLGLGIQPPTASWGSIIFEGARAFRSYPWIFFFPGLAIMLAVVSFNLLGDGLRDALDPRQYS